MPRRAKQFGHEDFVKWTELLSSCKTLKRKLLKKLGECKSLPGIDSFMQLSQSLQPSLFCKYVTN